MAEEMEVDSGAVAVKDEAVVNGHEPTEPTAITVDKVSLLQESVDKMALSMFNALRLLPANVGDESSKEETASAVRMFTAYMGVSNLEGCEIRSLANDVLRMVKETDSLIDDLPGLDKTESDQLEELRRLQIQSEEEAQTLRQVAEEAEQVINQFRVMAGKFSGRVYAGEDSEDDEEEEEIQYSFQYGSFSASQSSSSSTSATPAFSLPAAPRFNVQAPVAAAGGEGSDEDEDEESSGDEQKPFSVSTASTVKSITVSTPAAGNGEESEEDDSEDGGDAGEEKNVRADLGEVQLEEETKQLRITTAESVDAPSPLPSAKKAVPSPVLIAKAASTVAATKPQKQKIEDDDAHWQFDGSIGDGVQVMGDAIVSRLQPSLDDSIHRIAELTESQENAGICSSEQIKKVAIVMDKLPHYLRKIQDIKAAMAEISTSVEKMKKRAENLRVDAQSHAIKKENKRDSMSQWNKLYAAKSAELAANGSSAE